MSKTIKAFNRGTLLGFKQASAELAEEAGVSPEEMEAALAARLQDDEVAEEVAEEIAEGQEPEEEGE